MPDQLLVVDRPPRIQPELPVTTVKIPAPPKNDDQGMRRLMQLGLPLITIIGFSAISLTSGSGRGPMMAILMSMSVLATAAFGLFSYLQDKKQQALAEKAYAARIVALNQEMRSHHDQQRRFYGYNYPDTATTLGIPADARVQTERVERSLRTSVRLWERRPSDSDFGVVRLGLGTQPSSVVYELEGGGDEEDTPLLRLATKLQEDSRFVSNIPATISLRPPAERSAGAATDGERPEEEAAESQEALARPNAHAIGIAGKRGAVHEYIRALLAHYVVLHAPMDAKLYVIGHASDEWLWTQSLPHCTGTENQPLALLLDEPNQPGSDDDAIALALAKYLEGLRKLLGQRQMRLRDQDAQDRGDDPTLPFCLVVVDLLDVASGSPLGELESDAAVSLILKEGAALGAAIIFLAPERGKIPSDCQAIIEVESTVLPTNSATFGVSSLHFRYAQTGVNTFRFFGSADAVESVDTVRVLARELSQLDVRRGFGADLPDRVPFLALTDCESMAEIVAAARANWQSSRDAHDANWLRATLGMMGGGKPRTLVFSAREDGVHGMIAGSTGSGKSELLISLIVMLAFKYDPSALNFVLVDFKGGGAFAEFRDMPHCVDVITNLGFGGVTRMFAAIQAELRRRQKLLADTGTKDIVDYRQKNLHETREPYPFLFIIIDEFAELIADRPEFKSELESITRVGRALGVSLVLAAQRPSGVTDQMRSNIKLRISLRVESEGESREILRRTDAAFLPGSIPGRGFIQVGTDEIQPIQVAYGGDPYIDPASRPQVMWPDRPSSQRNRDHDRPQLYKAVVSALTELAQEIRVPEQHAPWPNPLPIELSLSDALLSHLPNSKAITSEAYFDPEAIDTVLLGARRPPTVSLNPAINRWTEEASGWVESIDWQRHAFRPVVGLVDNPSAAQQAPLVVNLVRGHAVVFGASGWGKTTFIRSLVVSMAATHTPAMVRFFILDLGGRNLSVLKQFPHVEAVVSPDEESYKEQVEQLIREFEDTLTRRKAILGTSGFSDIRDYNAANPESLLPGLVFIVDNFVEFKETFGQSRDSNVESALDRFVALARECRPYGIYLVISATQMNVLSSQLYNVFTERYALKLTDPTEYRAILGGAAEDPGDTTGRGYVNTDRQPLAFQVALPVDTGDSTQASELDRLAASMNAFIAREGRHYDQIIAVGSLPKSVLFRQILAREYGLPLDANLRQSLRELMVQHWADSREPATADWLQVPIGLMPGSRGVRTLHLEARRDGAHGLIAGGTGSGKSELLMALIVGLAINYSPDILNFVLVDYKGGGAFKPFETLPHCVDIVTNLNKAAVERMFTAIGAEVARRQALNAETNTKDIVEYRAKGLHLTRAPYPHLFVIIDEYAEMISDSPEFRAQLESITRTGRAQGVSLILASQRPTGVTDQMRSNIKLRMSLRVEDAATSREVLGRSDAAGLPNNQPGRGYIQVGNDNIELIQVAWTGDSSPDLQTSEQTEPPKFFDVVVDLASEIAGSDRPLSPWPPVMPSTLTFADPLEAAYLEAGTLVPSVVDGEPLSLNPAIQRWADGQGSWSGIDWETQAMRAVVGLVDDPFTARQLPLEIDFTRGHAVIFGSSGWGKTTFVRALVTSLAATHKPTEFQCHVLDLGGRGLDALRDLPHVGAMIIPDERGYEERVQQLLRKLNELVDRRKEDFAKRRVASLAEYNQAVDPADRLPAILVALDNMSEFLDTFGEMKAGPNNQVDALVGLIRQSKPYGVHFLITASNLSVITSRMFSLFTERLTLRLSSQEDYPSIVGSRVGELDEIAGRGYVRARRRALTLQVALVGIRNPQGQLLGESDGVNRVGQAMRQQVKDSDIPELFRIEALPNSLSFRQMVADNYRFRTGEPFVEQLKTAMAAEWEQKLLAKDPEWLRVTLGNTSGGGPREIRLEAKYDGVHGLIAGGTGSGKSELLMALIVGLAINYPPDLLNFVLVDYKGGGAFKQFETLPHCVDIVTNLNKAAVERMFTSIGAEVARRQALNADTNTKDIVDYRAKGLHLTREPYPHLFVIIDEYAEMISDNPDHKDKLESLTRVGRAQGVNLLLASQRPKGVSDQMRANIKLRICLRVEETDTSLEMLRRPDAAFLPGVPGRGYLQAGNENIELMQVAYTGEAQADDRPPRVQWPDRPARVDESPIELKLTLNDTVVDVATELREGKPTRHPWPAFLPERLSLQSPIYDSQKNERFTLTTAVTNWLNGEITELWSGIDWTKEAMQAVVGLIDDPIAARQPPLVLDLKQHLAVFGDTGWGKTSFLRTLMASLAATHSPAELHMYVLDLGGRNFRALEALPHCGAVICADDETFEERMQRLLERLSDLVDERQELFSRASVNGLYEYNQTFPDRAVPTVLVLIDNMAILRENYEMLVENTILPLVRRSQASGITFAVTANGPNGLSSKLLTLFGTQFTFKQNDTDKYMDIVGRGAVEFGDISGRGYLRVDRRPLQLQIALPVGIFDESGADSRREAEELGLLSGNMQRAWQDRGVEEAGPVPIPVLETRPLVSVLEAARAPRRRRIESALGVSADLRPAIFDLKRQAPHFLIAGPARSGRTTVLYNWALSLAERYPPDRVGLVLVDLPRRFVEYGGKHKLSELPHVIATAYEISELDEAINRLRPLAEAMASSEQSRELFILIDNFDDTVAELESSTTARDLSALVRRFDREGLHCIIVGGGGSSGFELQRRIRNAGYGVGLRTADSVAVLNAARTPAAFRGGTELPVGRGYIVRAGQTTMIQIADPYLSADPSIALDGLSTNGRGNGLTGPEASNGHADESDEDELEDANAIALDAWVERLIARYAGSTPGWVEIVPSTAEAPTETPLSPQVLKMTELVDRARQWEIQQRATKPDLEPVLQTKLDAFAPEMWRDESALLEVLRTALQRSLASVLGEDLATGMTNAMSPEDVMTQLEPKLPPKLPEEEADGVAS